MGELDCLKKENIELKKQLSLRLKEIDDSIKKAERIYQEHIKSCEKCKLQLKEEKEWMVAYVQVGTEN